MPMYATLPNGERVSIALKNVGNGFQAQFQKGFKGWIRKPKGYPKMFWKTMKEARQGLKTIPGFVETTKERLNMSDKPRAKAVAKVSPIYGDVKQFQRDMIARIATHELRKHKKVSALTFPGEHYSDNNKTCLESQLRVSLNATIFGLECERSTYRGLKDCKKINAFNMRDVEFFDKFPMNFDFLWLDYFGTFAVQKRGLISALKNNRINNGAVVALTYCLADRQGRLNGDANTRMSKIEKDIIRVSKQYGCDFSLELKQKYSNDDVKDKAQEMITLIFKVRC